MEFGVTKHPPSNENKTSLRSQKRQRPLQKPAPLCFCPLKESVVCLPLGRRLNKPAVPCIRLWGNSTSVVAAQASAHMCRCAYALLSASAFLAKADEVGCVFQLSQHSRGQRHHSLECVPWGRDLVAFNSLRQCAIEGLNSLPLGWGKREPY